MAKMVKKGYTTVNLTLNLRKIEKKYLVYKGSKCKNN